MRLIAAIATCAVALGALPAVAATNSSSSRITLSGTVQQGAIVTGRAPPSTVELRMNGEPVPLTPDGRFVIGFGRNAAPAVLLEARTDGGDTVRRYLSVARRSYVIERLPELRAAPAARPSREAIAQRRVELANIRIARLVSGTGLDWADPFVWPVKGRISGVYGSQRYFGNRAGPVHYGVDVAAPTGTPVLAPAGGVVKLARTGYSLEGGIIIIDHGRHLSSTMLHLSKVAVREGARIRQGQRIGAVGSTGRSTGPHLHWSMHWRGVRVDPQSLVGAMPAELSLAIGAPGDGQ